jgi:hypothetical protein|tara:strand:- start:153 stop:761 length:609 start_codon:yes stop_codon:yes gene_type:complete
MKIKISESELILTIEKIVNEQSAMLGFGNMGGLSLGVSKPTDKYELDEDAQDTNTSDTINVNYMDQNAANQSMEDWEMGEDYNGEKDDNVGKDKGKGYYCRCADGTLCHSNNSSCYGRCCVGEPVMAEGEEELEMDEDCGDGEMYEGGCGGEMYEDSGAFESNYFNSLQGIRTSDVYKESIESLIRKNLKESQKNQIRKWSR